MPDKLAIEIFERDLTRDHVVGCSETETEDTVENGAMVAIF